MAIRVPLTSEGHVDVPALRRAVAESAGEISTPSPARRELQAWHAERAAIEAAIGLDHLRQASDHAMRSRELAE